jgi:hypothetical protein
MAPGLTDEKDTPRIRDLAKGMRVVEDTKLGAALHELYAPDVETAPEIDFIHRKLPYADVYFVVNTSNRPVRSTLKFRVKGEQSECWNAFTGALCWSEAAEFAPYESRVIVFSKQARAPGATSDAAPAPIDIGTGWKVTIPGAPPVTMEKLEPWPERFFSGAASYEKTVAVDSATPGLYLDFGQGTPIQPGTRRSNGFAALLDPPVREAAVVYVNDRRAGSVWCPPYQVLVGPLLHKGENRIRIEVANTAINELANQPLPDYRALIAKYGERFQDQDLNDLQPLPSGLLGPIRLVAK